jgi:thioredoxin 2
MSSPAEAIHAVCPHCTAVNRVPVGRREEAPQCGACGKLLFTGKPVNADRATFDRLVGRSDLPVVVDFWAPWCGPCRAMAPQFEQAAGELAGRVQFAKVNSDEEPDLSARFGIRSIPTLILMRGGREIDRLSGALSSAQLVQWLARPR